MKTVWYEAVKAYLNKLLPAVIVLAFIANAAIFHDTLANKGENSFMVSHIQAYHQIINDYKDKPADEAYAQLKALNDQLQGFVQIQQLAQNTFGESPEDIDAQLAQMEEQHPGLIAQYNAKNYRLYSGSLETDAGLVNDVFRQIDYIHGYKAYIQSMTDRMNDMLSVSVFNKAGTFAYRNIIRTPQDFSGLTNIPLKLDVSAGTVCATDFELTDIFVIGIVFLLCIYLISLEKDGKLLPLVRSAKFGRGRTIASKLAVLALSSGAIALLFYGSNLMQAGQTIGFGNLSRYIQSIPEFRGCTALLTVGQYFAAFLACKALAAMLIAGTIFTVILLASNSSFAYAVLAAVLAGEWAAWKFIPVTSFANHLKFINLFGYLDAFGLFANYQNLNLFGQPVNVRLLAYIVVPLGLACVAALCHWGFVKFRYSERIGVFGRALDWIRRSLSRLPGTASLFLHESYKLLIAQKALLVLALLLVMQYYAVSNYFVVKDFDQTVYQHYLAQVDGRLTAHTDDYIAAEQANFDNAPAVLAQAASDYKAGKITEPQYNGIVNRTSTLQQRATAFGWITQQYEYLRQVSKEKGVQAGFVDPMGYSQLFSLNGYSNDLNNELLLTAVLIACLAAVFAQDNALRARKIVITCLEGRGKAVRRKYLAGILVAVCAWALIYGAQFYNICTWYKLTDWNAPVQSVMAFGNSTLSIAPQFAAFPLHITIAQYALLIYGIRLLGTVALVSVILLISSLSMSVFVSIFASTMLLEVPPILYMLGFGGAKYFSFVEIMSGNMLLANQMVPAWIAFTVLLLAAITASVLLLARRLYSRSPFQT